jgi:hypothetical protein
MVRMFMREGERRYVCIPGLNIVTQARADWRVDWNAIRWDRDGINIAEYCMCSARFAEPIGFEYMYVYKMYT